MYMNTNLLIIFSKDNLSEIEITDFFQLINEAKLQILNIHLQLKVMNLNYRLYRKFL